MKKYIGNFFRKKAGKRIVSGLTAFVMVFCALPAAEIGEKLSNLDFSTMIASADDTPTFRNLTLSEFYAYSRDYDPVTNQNDVITIKTSGGGQPVYYERGFKSLGTQSRPFNGEIKMGSGMDNVVLNLDAPLFEYVYDTVKLNYDSENNTTKTLNISRFYGHIIPDGDTVVDTTPLIAKNVVDKGGDVTWKVNIVKPSATDDSDDGVLECFGGMIGTMGKDSKLTLDVTMDTQTGDTAAINMKSKSHVGLACGLMDTDSEMIFSIGKTSGGTQRKVSKIETSSGNAGGLVGEMRSGSAFTYKDSSNIMQDNAVIRTTSDGYAGGIVGKISEADVTLPNAYPIKQYMSGTNGSGSVYGYFMPKADESTIDLTKYSIASTTQVNGAGSCGGVVGVLECDHDFNINASTTVNSNHASGNATAYGGLIGKYTNTAAENSLGIVLSITGTTNPNKGGGGASYFGGAIGVVDNTNPSYVKFDGFTVNEAVNASALTFGGLVGKAANAFIDANNITIKVNGTFSGGGVVGDLGNGVLRLTGTTDLSNAKSSAPVAPINDSEISKYGQIVGYRGSALIFAEEDWILKRSEATAVDDIGGWGEVLRFSSTSTDTQQVYDEETEEYSEHTITTEYYANNSVFEVDETTHKVTVGSVTNSIGSVAAFAKIALNIQLDNNEMVSGVDNTIGNLTLSSNIDLRGTGLMGFTRDHNTDNNFSESHCAFTKTFDGNNKTITLAIGEAYGFRGTDDLSTASDRTDGDGRIYNHRYNGLFGVMKPTQVRKLILDGSCSVSPRMNSVYVGAVTAVANDKVTLLNVQVRTAFDYSGSEKINLYLGRLIGEISNLSEQSGTTRSVSISSCTASGNVTGSHAGTGTCIGGVVGKIYHLQNETHYWDCIGLTLSGKIENSAQKTEQIIGGLIALIEGYSATSGYKSRQLTLNNINITSEISGGKATSMGGMLGYRWLNTDVIVGASDKPVNINSGSAIKALGNVKDMAGIVYNATGKWTVNKLNINSINVTASSPRSFGMIVNKGWYTGTKDGEELDHLIDATSSAIYMILPSSDCYSITKANVTLSTLNSADVFDELVAYSAYYREQNNTRYNTDDSGDMYILQNGAGVVSVYTSSLVMDGTNASKSYKAQTTQGAKANPWTRYYYNLDTVTSKNASDLGTAQKKLMSWGLNKYAHQSIRANFVNPFGNSDVFTADSTAEYDMTGYSWYPVDVESNVTIQGIFKFDNYGFENSEDKNGGTDNSQKTSLYRNGAPITTQHFMMHAGLFRNVYSGRTLTVKSTTLRGNVPLYKAVGSSDTDYCGMIVCGTIAGSSDTSKAEVDIDGLTLEGAYIHNIGSVSASSSSYAPLVINRITQYTNLTAKNITTSTESGKTYTTSSYVPHIKTDESYPKAASSLIGEVGSATAKGINLTFTRIRLDGRKADIGTAAQNSALDTAYGTQRSIFTKATLLDKFQFESGTTGSYTYTWENDWGSDGRYVTYGKEVGYTSEGEFPNKERMYLDYSGKYTNPIANDDERGTFTGFNDFLPYVYESYNKQNKTHQIEVNHKSETSKGCGTYNHPYLIGSGEELEGFAKIINGGNLAGTKVILPATEAERTAKWCDDKEAEHKLYEYDSSGNFVNGSDSIPAITVREYLAGAYYRINTNGIELTSDFLGLGCPTNANDNDKKAVFRGVIDGADFTIRNKSDKPLILTSYGSVVRNLTVIVDNESIEITQSDASSKFPISASYGGVFGAIIGGDNIIDNVSVSYASGTTIKLYGDDYTQIIPIGGYVGVVENGGLFFRNMEKKSCTLPPISADNWGETIDVDLSGFKWLYINPFIGRVINGFAVNETSAYHTAESTQTLKNTNKNYSITDIKSALKKGSDDKYILSEDEKLYVAPNGTYPGINLFNSQALFTLSLMVNSGMCIMSDYNSGSYTSGAALGYYTGNTVTRGNAQYNDLNTDTADKTACSDYQLSLTDARWADQTTDALKGAVVPYLIRYYTKKHTDNGYYARRLTHSSQQNTIRLRNTDTSYVYELPDGFKGIGNFYTGIDDHTLRVKALIGGNNTIDQNTSYYCYLRTYDNYPPYSVVQAASKSNGKRAGLGLFNCQIQDVTNGNGFEAFTLTGKVQSDVFENAVSGNAGTHIAYNQDNINDTGNPQKDSKSDVISCGALIGAACGNLTMTNVTLKDIDIRAARHAGGLVGIIAASGKTVTVNNTSNKDWENIKVHAGANAGGMLGANMAGFIKVTFNNCSIKLNEIVSELSETQVYGVTDYINKNTYFQYGLGGIIGVLRQGGSTETGAGDSSSYIKNLIIENNTSGTPATVGSLDYGAINTGGLIGMVNRAHVLIDNCAVKNISCKANGYAGGLIGWNTTYSEMIINNTDITTDNATKAEIIGAKYESEPKVVGVAGGYVGKTGGDQTVGFTIKNSSIKNYTISGNEYSGGVIGARESSRNKDMCLQNFEISGCTIKGNNYVGGICGQLKSGRMVGYNILASDLTFAAISGSGDSSHRGYIVGENNGSKDIILVGFSRKGDMTVRKMVGNYDETASSRYGSNGYVVFADYTNAANEVSRRSNVFSYINSLNNVASQSGTAASSVRMTRVETEKKKGSTSLSKTSEYSYEPLSTVTAEQAETQTGSSSTTVDGITTIVKTYQSVKNYLDNSPYVTSSPKRFIGTGQFLTGDGVSAAEYSNENFAFKNIIEDKKSDIAGCYSAAPSINDTILNEVTSHLSTSQKEYNDRTMSDFPLLIVEDTDKTKVTSYINYYLRNLTNTNLDFANAGQGETNANKFKVALHKCVYDRASGKFIINASDSSASLKQYHRNGDFFQMNASEIDNADMSTPQFSLMDIQFYDPSTVSGTTITNAKVAYHLYVPIYVKKLIQYEFSAKLASGTNYYPSAYADISKGNTLFDNLGNPVTMQIQYTYDRTVDDWSDAINGGENVLTNFYKGFQLALDSTGWNTSTRLVLVDANNDDKNYYLDSSFNNGDNIELESFTTEGSVGGTPSGEHYKPAPLNNLFDITFAEVTDGPLIRTNTEREATVKDSSGNFYKLRPDDDTESQGYTSTVTAVRPETYYLSIFTNKNIGSSNIYHYVISSMTQFGRHGDSDTGWKPNKIKTGEIYNMPAHLFIGKLYTNEQMELSVVPRRNTYKMSKENNALEVTMTAHVGLTGTAKSAGIAGNLSENPSSTIYQTFLMNYDMQEKISSASAEVRKKIGVETAAISSITVSDYTFYYGLEVPETEAERQEKGTSILPLAEKYDPEKLMTSNYIELRNGVNLNPYLSNSDSDHKNTATIRVTFLVEYSDKTLAKQFPERNNESSETNVGSMVRGFSNISSTAESGAYSATSKRVEDYDVARDSYHRYYTTDPASATLTYNAEKTMESADGQYSSLGINPFDDGTKTTNIGHIDSTATYSYLDLQTTDEYIEFNLTLTCKNDNGYDNVPLDIRQYFNNLTIKAGSTELYKQGTSKTETDYKSFMSSDGKKITLRAKKDVLKRVADKVYSINISFDVLTGEANGFGTTKAYSNYKVNLTADMYGSIDTTATPDTQPHASDHIIYTNSKLQYKMI